MGGLLPASLEELEYLVSAYIEVLWDSNGSRSSGSYLLAGLQFFLRRRRLFHDAWTCGSVFGIIEVDILKDRRQELGCLSSALRAAFLVNLGVDDWEVRRFGDEVAGCLDLSRAQRVAGGDGCLCVGVVTVGVGLEQRIERYLVG